jgi:hypothetical protein
MWTLGNILGHWVGPHHGTFILGYVGPGLGAAVVGVVLGLLTSVLLALFTIFWYPIKRCMAFFRSKCRPARDSCESS